MLNVCSLLSLNLNNFAASCFEKAVLLLDLMLRHPEHIPTRHYNLFAR